MTNPMASELKSHVNETTNRNQVGGYLMSFLKACASLKLTVSLLILSVVVTFIGTLEQTRNDIYPVKKKYFLSNDFLVEVPVKVFLVPEWFPNMQDTVSDDLIFYVPSGTTILILMIINMLTAHLLRFRVQARGSRLVFGMIFSAFAAVVTWAVIFNAQVPGREQGTPPIPWSTMWTLLRMVILGGAVASAFGFATIHSERKVERTLLGMGALLAAGALVLTFLLPSAGYIGDSAMRIVWQLGQSTLAACVALVASLLLFKRKGGIVLLHLGILGLIANELYVNYTNVEQRISLQEGQTSSTAIDIRSTQLSVIDVSDPTTDKITAVPQSELTSGQRINHPDLPFDLRVISFFENSNVDNVKDQTKNRANRGAGLKIEAEGRPVVNGIKQNQRNFASAYIELFKKGTEESLGQFLVSQFFELPQLTRVFGIQSHDQVEVDGKTYYLNLCFKTEYKPYSLMLKDVTAEYYVATSTPRYFSSEIVFSEPAKSVSFEKKIWMNNPMRYGGETFYQTSYDNSTGVEVSTLQIVTNRGWMIPYVCCMYTVVGLLIQFGATLLSFLEKRGDKVAISSRKNLAAPPAIPSQSPSVLATSIAKSEFQDSGRTVAIIVSSLLALSLVFLAFRSYTGTVKKDDFRLDLLGRIPATKNGRVQPLDSIARHTVMQLTKKDSVNNQNEVKQPAIRWLADTMFEAEGYDAYRLFRIESSDILNSLELPYPMPTDLRQKKSNMRYTLDEIREARSKMKTLLPKDPEKANPFEQAIGRIAGLANQVSSFEMIFGDSRIAKLDTFERLQIAEVHAENQAIPLIVPTGNLDQPWASVVAIENRNWLKELADQYQVSSIEELAKVLVVKEFVPIQREQLIKERVLDRILSSDELLKAISKDDENIDKSKLRKLLESRWESIPPEKTEALRAVEGPLVDAMLTQQLPRVEKIIAQQLATVNGGKSGAIQLIESPHLEDLRKIRDAYIKGDAGKFNQTLERYLAAVNANPPRERNTETSEGNPTMRPSGVSLEYWYNGFAPFYWSAFIYGIVILIEMLTWLPNSMNTSRIAWRTSGALLWLGLVVHVVGLVARIIISGRPPVTNLYSSFLFVGAISVLGVLILNQFFKLRVNHFLAGLLGFLTLFAVGHMQITDGDTFSVLVAVLDTQFWLATHVVTITIGYGATLIAGFFGLAFILQGVFTSRLDQTARKEMSKAIYGTACFGLLTSFFGTVLGGLWGDDSWGRFWGWDPKENGALMIVLWNAVILHARWGGMVHDRGLAVLAILGNVITLWSWKGVNALGVGLHAYSGTEDKALKYIIVFGMASLVVAGIGLIPKQLWPSFVASERKK